MFAIRYSLFGIREKRTANQENATPDYLNSANNAHPVVEMRWA